MNRHQQTLKHEGWTFTLKHPASFVLQEADTVVDDAVWGRLPLLDVQRRLEEADDFAVIVLETTFETRGTLRGLVITANGEGLRNMLLDKNYMVPVKGQVEPGTVAYRLPEPLSEGEHVLRWSYAWNPPKDRSSGEAIPGGVALRAPVISGPFVVHMKTVVAPPRHVDLHQLPLLDPTGPFSVHHLIDVPVWARNLHIEGTPHSGFEVDVEHIKLVSRSDSPWRGALPPATNGSVEITLHFQAVPKHPISHIELLP